MKRPVDAADDPDTCDDKRMKKIKTEEEDNEEEEEAAKTSAVVLMDENLLYEVLKHVDARTLATVACVSKQWHKTAQDERLWELICTRQGANIGCGNQLRSVVLALGGFRRLHSLYLLRLSKPSSSSSSSSSSAWPCLPVIQSKPPAAAAATTTTTTKNRWGKDEVNLSLSLLSIRYYEKMNFNNRSK
uniref:F-box protein GID2 n=1 Tax=Davidia involucrata TaxID=16924 RepID=A0A5B7CAW2_DAVIN